MEFELSKRCQKQVCEENKMFDAGTSWLLVVMSSPGMFYPQLGMFLPPVLEACFHALVFALFQAPSAGIKWACLSQNARHWEAALWLLPLLAIAIEWMGRIQPGKSVMSAPGMVPKVV